MKWISRSRYVLRRKDTGEYFCRRGWVAKPEVAVCFELVSDAGRACMMYGLDDVELVPFPAHGSAQVIRRTGFERRAMAEAAYGVRE